MKRHIKASLITLLIMSAIVGLGYSMILYPQLLVSIFMCLALAVVVVAIYQLVLIHLKKEDNEEI
jgi:uncharacterized membrane protein